MKKEQEARILSNQILIMRALQVVVMGKGSAHNELGIRIRDTEEFIQNWLK